MKMVGGAELIAASGMTRSHNLHESVAAHARKSSTGLSNPEIMLAR
jgi:hypothetical protein